MRHRLWEGLPLKISLTEPGHQPDAASITGNKVDVQMLVDAWSAGLVAGAAQAKGSSGTAEFAGSDVLFVRARNDVLPLDLALEADFSARHLSAACWTTAAEAQEYVLAFQLPEEIQDREQFARLLTGIETVYLGCRTHSKVLDQYGLPGDVTGEALGGRLTMEAVEMLATLGEEGRRRPKVGGYIRSLHQVGRASVLRLPDGTSATLEQLAPGQPIFCPVHVDRWPHAVAYWYANGTPGVQCERCKRTFTTPAAKKGYDFDQFERVMAELSKERQVTVRNRLVFEEPAATTLSERYLPSVEPFNGVTLVKSPKGTNKTGALEGLIAEYKRQHARILLIGHRRALLQSVADRLGLTCYLSAERTPQPSKLTKLVEMPNMNREQSAIDSSNISAPTFLPPTASYAICLDSLTELDPMDKNHQYPIVIIDEAEQVFAHLVGDTVKERRREVFAKLSYYMRKAYHLVLLDADLNMVTTEAILSILKGTTPVEVIINQPKIDRGPIKMYSQRGQLADLLAERAAMGQKLFISTNSKRRAEELEKIVLASNPAARVKTVTSENTQSPDTQGLLLNIAEAFEHQLDVLIASPAVGTGIDITFKDDRGEPREVVDAVFGFFEANITTHSDIDQQLMRVRHPKEVDVWVDTRSMQYETDTGCIKRELEKSVRQAYCLLKYEDDGRPVFSDDQGLIDIWAQVEAASRGSKNRLAELFKNLREHDGWSIQSVEANSEADAAGKKRLIHARKARADDRELRILNAQEIDKEQAERLSRMDEAGLSLTESERHSLERYRIEDFYRADVSSDLIAFDKEGSQRGCVRLLECLISDVEWFARRDSAELANKRIQFDLQLSVVKRDVLSMAFSAANIFEPNGRTFSSDATVCAADLRTFVRTVDRLAAQIESLFGMPLYGDRMTKPVKQLAGLLKLVGLELKQVSRKQAAGKCVRRYSIDADLLDRMHEVVRLRDDRFKRSGEAP